MKVTCVDQLEAVPREQWQSLRGTRDNPFVDHAFLSALERHGCVGERWGWLPRHLLVRDNGRLVGAAPMYVKYNSYGEFVFDWSWADAYARSGMNYYPKLVVGIPYTPATGPRLLVTPDAESSTAIRKHLVEGAITEAGVIGASSVHWLFTDADDTAVLRAKGLPLRTGCQFHWSNRGYRDFDDFLSVLTASKRKKIRRERRRVGEAGIRVERLNGHTAEARHWDAFHTFYRSTFDRHGGYATLNRGFFAELANRMPGRVLLVMASVDNRYVAGAFCLQGSDTLYGRHWGCDADYHSLHFEICYYQGIEHCITQGLQRFEPGAQGEHKVSRGFVPTTTQSAHWIADRRLAAAVQDFTERERQLMADYMDELRDHLPFRATETPIAP